MRSPKLSRPDVERVIIGIRPGEKLSEVLLTEDESRHAHELDDCYVIHPEFPLWREDPYRRRLAGARRLPLQQRHQPRQAHRRGAAGDAAVASDGALTDFLPYGRQTIDEADVAAVSGGPGATRCSLKGRVWTRSSGRSPNTSASRHAVAFANGTAALHAAAARGRPRPGRRAAHDPAQLRRLGQLRAVRRRAAGVLRHRPRDREPRPAARARARAAGTAPRRASRSRWPDCRSTSSRCRTARRRRPRGDRGRLPRARRAARGVARSAATGSPT